MIKKFFITLTLMLLNSYPTHADIAWRQYNGNIYIQESTVAELEDLFTKSHYRRFRGLENNAYPAIFVTKLPSDFNQIKSLKYRNELFIRILAPLALKINEELSNERHTLLRIERNFMATQTLSAEETNLLEGMAQKYDYFTRFKDNHRIAAQIENLKQRINIIPPSVLIAAAAMETNWGDSRLAQQANSLYKEKIWYTEDGLVPQQDTDDDYHFKTFSSLIESMRSFAITLNSDIKFSSVWESRTLALKWQDNLIGENIAFTLSTASNLPNFAGILDYTTAFYDLMAIDIGHLKRLPSFSYP
ncbi:MAG: glucosaminidase domain-containing protein [Alphaproteobacteria bacterium]|nr:glucosaminidase domain-containing protein [Alphaproteobacteria bacterium]